MTADAVWFRRIGADTGRLADGVAGALLKARPVQKQGGVQSLHQGNEKLERQKHSAKLTHRLGLDLTQGVSAVEQLNGTELQHVQPLWLPAKPELSRKNDHCGIQAIQSRNQARTEPG